MLRRSRRCQSYRKVLRAIETGAGKRNRWSADLERTCQADQRPQDLLRQDPGQENTQAHMYAAIESKVCVVFARDIKLFRSLKLSLVTVCRIQPARQNIAFLYGYALDVCVGRHITFNIPE